MPRTKTGVNKAVHISANIAYYASFYGYTQERLAAVLHCSPGTLRSRRKNPGSFTIEELQRLADSFSVSLSDLILKKEKPR